MSESLVGRALIATPALTDPNFHKTVVLLFAHTDEGAVGLVINRPLDVRESDVYEALDIEAKTDASAPALYGGPVSPDVGWVIHSGGFSEDDTVQVGADMFVSASVDLLRLLAKGQGPERHLICLGYAGWAPDQLEQEIMDSAWLVCTPSPELLFTLPFEQRWRAAYGLLGIDPGLVVPGAASGNA